MAISMLGELIIPVVRTYANGGTALQLECEDGEAFATMSVWTPESPALPRDVVFIKSWSENEPLVPILVNAGVIARAPEFPAAACGWCQAEAYRIASEYMPAQ